jgi:hypothetical protein
MGAVRLKVAVLVLVAGCAASAPPAAEPTSRVSLVAHAGAHGPHLQIVRAMPTRDRVDVVERFRARNGAAWTFTVLPGEAPDEVDPLLGLVRRAKRDEAPGAGVSIDQINQGTAIAEGTAFLSRNADFFGLDAGDIATLDMAAGTARTSTYGAWVVRVRGHRLARGYEGFGTVASKIDILLYIGEDGRTRYFVNASSIHPRLTLDTTPILGPDDARITKDVIGRELFAAIDDPRLAKPRVRELRRISLGRVEKADVRATHLTIHVSPGPRGVYVTYQLAYAVDVAREHHRFRFVVDADTGALLEDAVVPIVRADGDDALAP